jgi:arylsulfatase A-like enzyme
MTIRRPPSEGVKRCGAVAAHRWALAAGLVIVAALVPRQAPGDDGESAARAAAARPNVLFLAVDDLNDWIGPLGGHPQAITPHLDRFASRAVTFRNAHCQAPICNPSRVSLLTGVLPSSSGVYYLAPLLRAWQATSQAVSLPQHFARCGYTTIGAGKIFHVEGDKEFQTYGGQFGGFGPRPSINLNCGHVNPLWDWGPFPDEDPQLADSQLADWICQQLREPRERPWFLACGFYRPHVPLYVPQKWFDLYPLEQVQLPAHLEDDLNDVPDYGRDLSWSAMAPRHRWMVEHDQWRRGVQAYLASVSFVDAQIGKILAALEQSGLQQETIVIIWSDHGFHLGTKQRWGKRSLWEAATRVVLMIEAPGYASGAASDRPVGLIDLYPTLIEMCGLDPLLGLDGHSLVPLLQDPQRDWVWPALTTFGQHNHAVRSQNFRYIRYADGTEELYDHRTDPHEFVNLARRGGYAEVLEQHRRWLPQVNQPLAPGSANADARPGSAADIDGQPVFPWRPVQADGVRQPAPVTP